MTYYVWAAYKEHTVIYLVNDTIYNSTNIKNLATYFGSIEPSLDQIQDTVLVPSASAYTMVSRIVYKLY
jgi:hypothetical protein